jgi:putative CocE/NonD family hydrolase
MARIVRTVIPVLRAVPAAAILAAAVGAGGPPQPAARLQRDQLTGPRPPAKHEVRLRESVMVPMPDGVRLATDVYFPVGLEGRLPVLLIRTPYNKRTHRADGTEARFFAGQGFVVAVQDLRGKHESEGEFVQMSGKDPGDGYATIDWLAAQPWSSGKIATYGCSYLGETQIALAARRHPNHVAAIAKAAGGNYAGKYTYFGQYEGGVLELAGAFGWAWGSGNKVYLRAPRDTPEDVRAMISRYFTPGPTLPTPDYASLLRSLPIAGLMERAGALPNDFRDFVTHAPADPWWKSLGYTHDEDRFDLPVLHVDSWFNGSIEEQLDLVNLMARRALSSRGRDHQYAVISPTTHCQSELASERTMVGDLDVGDARFDYFDLYVRWLDHWLRGVDNGVTRMPKLRLFVMGRAQWREESQWPPEKMRPTRYFLHSDGRANSRFGTGVLSTAGPGDAPADSFVYDPRTPVPTLGGSICCTGNPADRSGSFDQSTVETRHDVLVYTGAPLERGLEVTGPIEVTLFVSSTARDTDFTAKLVDVHPDGRAFNIQSGIMRARYREGYDRTVWMAPDVVSPVRINLHVTSTYFRPGHRVRLEVSSSDFPRFERNLNTGGGNVDESAWVVATNTVHHSEKYPSHLTLPVVPDAERESRRSR